MKTLQKIIWIKYLIIGLIFSSTFLSCSPGEVGEKINDIYVYTNTTEQLVSIHVYSYNHDLVYNVLPGKQLKIDEFNDHTVNFIINADSIIVSNDLGKILKFNRNTESSKNIIQDKNYNRINLYKNFYENSYIFSNSFFE
ncbi:MAG: hypothetical protein K2X95_10750 [Flavobacteriaceae bacterium]|nr:hypothetical protein [Flavobacteriaceae bacterium]